MIQSSSVETSVKKKYSLIISVTATIFVGRHHSNGTHSATLHNTITNTLYIYYVSHPRNTVPPGTENQSIRRQTIACVFPCQIRTGRCGTGCLDDDAPGTTPARRGWVPPRFTWGATWWMRAQTTSTATFRIFSGSGDRLIYCPSGDFNFSRRYSRSARGGYCLLSLDVLPLN